MKENINILDKRLADFYETIFFIEEKDLMYRDIPGIDNDLEEKWWETWRKKEGEEDEEDDDEDD